MIGINSIGFHIASERISNLEKTEKHGVTHDFIAEKIGIASVARKKSAEKASDLCVSAYDDLAKRVDESALDDIEFLCVCTQNGDYHLPQASAIVQSKLGISKRCAAFDISLGCSGYVYSLHIAKSFMDACGLKKGLLFTSDPYSEIIDTNDKNTDLLFGDGAAATLLTDNPVFDLCNGVFETDGNMFEHLIKRDNEKLAMNGRGIFNFAMINVPELVTKCLKANALRKEDIDLFLLHQASKYIIDNLCRRMKLEQEKVPFLIKEYGNTVSSSIPIALREYLDKTDKKNILICGFGVGLSIAASVLRRR
ncbi:MAG: ketoacyl-ACP synthase III [Desulfobacteraceae bacterium]|nr:ketoacyl-ACP synthase III [Desulfobacteraceae bacterium]MBC2718996.1 ketoacyl-ACP synthase III [Desulfobacteraceae bacterium]